VISYIYKITSKNFAQIQQHAKDVIALLDTSAYDRFLDRMGQLMSATEAVHVVMSFDYEELIGPNFLKDRLEGVLSTETDD
jgi:hypothetical protein